MEIDALEYPGHGSRLNEQLPSSVEELSTAIVESLEGAWSKCPFVIIGHSLGALVAFRITQMLESRKGPLPRQLLLCGSSPPDAIDSWALHTLPDADLVEHLSKIFEGMHALQSSVELLDLFLPIIRNDLRMAETWRMTDTTPVETPMVAIAGREDPLAPPEGVKTWARFSSGPFKFHAVEGKHFFLTQNLRILCTIAVSI